MGCSSSRSIVESNWSEIKTQYDKKEYRQVKLISKGYLGAKHLVVSQPDKQELVLQKVDIPFLLEDSIDDVKKCFNLEKSTISAINSKYIIKYFDSDTEDSFLLEYANQGSLAELIKDPNLYQKEYNLTLTSSFIFDLVIDIFLGLHDIHSKARLRHRNLTAEKILIHNNSIKILGLGYAHPTFILNDEFLEMENQGDPNLIMAGQNQNIIELQQLAVALLIPTKENYKSKVLQLFENGGLNCFEKPPYNISDSYVFSSAKEAALFFFKLKKSKQFYEFFCSKQVETWKITTESFSDLKENKDHDILENKLNTDQPLPLPNQENLGTQQYQSSSIMNVQPQRSSVQVPQSSQSYSYSTQAQNNSSYQPQPQSYAHSSYQPPQPVQQSLRVSQPNTSSYQTQSYTQSYQQPQTSQYVVVQSPISTAQPYSSSYQQPASTSVSYQSPNQSNRNYVQPNISHQQENKNRKVSTDDKKEDVLGTQISLPVYFQATPFLAEAKAKNTEIEYLQNTNTPLNIQQRPQMEVSRNLYNQAIPSEERIYFNEVALQIYLMDTEKLQFYMNYNTHLSTMNSLFDQPNNAILSPYGYKEINMAKRRSDEESESNLSQNLENDLEQDRQQDRKLRIVQKELSKELQYFKKRDYQRVIRDIFVENFEIIDRRLKRIQDELEMELQYCENSNDMLRKIQFIFDQNFEKARVHKNKKIPSPQMQNSQENTELKKTMKEKFSELEHVCTCNTQNYNSIEKALYNFQGSHDFFQKIGQFNHVSTSNQEKQNLLSKLKLETQRYRNCVILQMVYCYQLEKNQGDQNEILSIVNKCSEIETTDQILIEVLSYKAYLITKYKIRDYDIISKQLYTQIEGIINQQQDQNNLKQTLNQAYQQEIKLPATSQTSFILLLKAHNTKDQIEKVQIYENALTLNKSNFECLEKICDYFMSANNFQKAEFYISMVDEENKFYKSVVEKKIKCIQAQKKWQSLINYLTSINIALGDFKTFYYISLIDAYIQINNFKQAEEIMNEQFDLQAIQHLPTILKFSFILISNNQIQNAETYYQLCKSQKLHNLIVNLKFYSVIKPISLEKSKQYIQDIMKIDPSKDNKSINNSSSNSSDVFQQQIMQKIYDNPINHEFKYILIIYLFEQNRYEEVISNSAMVLDITHLPQDILLILSVSYYKTGAQSKAAKIIDTYLNSVMPNIRYNNLYPLIKSFFTSLLKICKTEKNIFENIASELLDLNYREPQLANQINVFQYQVQLGLIFVQHLKQSNKIEKSVEVFLRNMIFNGGYYDSQQYLEVLKQCLEFYTYYKNVVSEQEDEQKYQILVSITKKAFILIALLSEFDQYSLCNICSECEDLIQNMPKMDIFIQHPEKDRLMPNEGRRPKRYSVDRDVEEY